MCLSHKRTLTSLDRLTSNFDDRVVKRRDTLAETLLPQHDVSCISVVF